MKYNYALIGERIKNERKAAGYKSHDALCDALRDKYGYAITRRTLGEIENGERNHYDADFLFYLCDLFGCEMGYLLGEYDCRTGRNTDIAAATGLSEKAIERLDADGARILSGIIEGAEYGALMRAIGDYVRLREIANLVNSDVSPDTAPELFNLATYNVTTKMLRAIDSCADLPQSKYGVPTEYARQIIPKLAAMTNEQINHYAKLMHATAAGHNIDMPNTDNLTESARAVLMRDPSSWEISGILSGYSHK